uniref:Secreted protein n=1 Tax=Chlamydomonas euryale TaxID=1486919 RepID=A0A7R9Z1H1_9CHLO
MPLLLVLLLLMLLLEQTVFTPPPSPRLPRLRSATRSRATQAAAAADATGGRWPPVTTHRAGPLIQRNPLPRRLFSAQARRRPPPPTRRAREKSQCIPPC